MLIIIYCVTGTSHFRRVIKIKNAKFINFQVSSKNLISHCGL